MRLARVTMALAGCVLTAVLAAGCSHKPAGPPRPSVENCIQYGVNAIEHHIVVKWQPRVCHGLSKAQLNYAVGRAIYAVAGSGKHKAAWRARARAAGVWLAHLVTSVPRPASATPVAVPQAPTRPAPHGGGTGIAALVAWLVTVATGGYMLVRWLRRGGLRHRRRGGLHPGVIFTHFGMATAGLVAWILYIATNWAASAWAAVGVLMPVTGLGIVLVTLSAPARFARMGGAPARTSAPDPAAPPVRRRGMPIPMIAGHGIAASLTVLFALLAALSAR